MIDLDKLEDTIAKSFTRANVLSVQDAKEHAALAVTHVRNAVALERIEKERTGGMMLDENGNRSIFDDVDE